MSKLLNAEVRFETISGNVVNGTICEECLTSDSEARVLKSGIFESLATKW
jgi:hypothetical protein